jgi:uncharacterized protein with ATP-grasp and redox domains
VKLFVCETGGSQTCEVSKWRLIRMEQIEREQMHRSWKEAMDHEWVLLIQRQIEALKERYQKKRVTARCGSQAMKLVESRVEDAEAYNSSRARRSRGTFAIRNKDT